MVHSPELTSTMCPQVGFSERYHAVTSWGCTSNGPQWELERILNLQKNLASLAYTGIQPTVRSLHIMSCMHTSHMVIHDKGILFSSWAKNAAHSITVCQARGALSIQNLLKTKRKKKRKKKRGSLNHSKLRTFFWLSLFLLPCSHLQKRQIVSSL